MNRILVLISLLAIASACRSGKEIASREKIKTTVATIKKEYAPDKRVAIFKVEPTSKKGAVILKGETNLPDAKSKLLAQLQAQNISFQDSIQVLPASLLGDKTYGVVSISVANIRSEPEHSAELATQATLGTPLKILNKVSYWYQVQTPDNYISWVDEGGIQLMNKSQFDAWQNAEKLIYLDLYGFSYTEPKADVQSVSDLVSGNVLLLKGESNGFYKIAYPDGREAYIPTSTAKPYSDWVASLHISEESLVSTAKQLMGIPYLWGGTSLKGVDCSGFTKTVFFLNGLVLPRDASQQVHTGDEIDTSNGFSELKPGDLLFFGRPATATTAEKVIHVGMWIGNNEFIHSSGKVRINSLDKKAANFYESTTNRFLRAKRILNTNNSGDILKLQSAKVY
jgi:cell wall-associated NlpC family hydrolase